MTRFATSFIFALVLLTMLSISSAKADEQRRREDDHVMLNLTAEDWVTTKTARVTVNVEAAVNSNSAGTMRADMYKAVNDVIKTDWRLTSFDRSQDQTGLERWSAVFEARVPENQLSGLGEIVKKLSKAGMQLSVGDIDFSPTLAEMEATRAELRGQIYKQVNDQLAALNAAIPGRNFRISMINFTGEGPMPMMAPMPRMMRAGPAVNMAMASAAVSEPESPAERAEKVTLTAHVVFSALPETASTSDAKH